MSIRVVIAEDNALLRDGLARLVASTADLELAGTAGTYDELLALVATAKPHVVVTDIRMPPSGASVRLGRSTVAVRSDARSSWQAHVVGVRAGSEWLHGRRNGSD